jgi:Leucine-rich repeat (LRR) protein
MQLIKNLGTFTARRRVLLAALALFAAVGLLWALYATPYDGPWTGTNSESRAVSFTVSGGGTQWSSFSYAIEFVCSYTGTPVTTTVTLSGPGAITDGQFSYSSPTLAFTGAFDTATTASGTYTLTNYSVIHGLPGPPYVHTDYITLSGTWTATFGGTVPTITVTSPNGGESWEAGSAHDITWTSTGTVPNVKLDYSTDGGTGWMPIAASVSNTGAFSWTIPSVVSATCLVRASDAAYPDVQDTSDAVFAISEALSITVTSPNGGETWETGVSSEITWTSTGSVGNVRIEISFDGGGYYYVIDDSTENDGAYSIASVWEYPSTSCLVRVSETDGSPSDASDAVFSIVTGPSVTVTSPNGGESWTIATTQNITWTSTGSVENVKLEYWIHPEMVWKTIVASTANTGTYAWNVPGPASVYCQIRVSDVAHEGKTDTNDGGFSILTNTTLQRQALIALYNATDGDHWSNNGGWKTPPLAEDGFAMPGTEGTWAGLIVESQTVVRINLGYNGLTGSLPAELGDLTSLYQIEFWSNQLSGPIPATLGNLTRMYSIRLDHNQLSGPIPPELGNLTSLYYLLLENNQLSGSIPPELGGLSFLGNAYFDSNLLSGPLPRELGNLTGLDALSFSDNQLSGAIPPELGNMTGLNYLYLSGNQLSGAIPPELGNLSGLETLDLQFNHLSGPIPAELGSLSNLRRLHLESNELSGPIPVELGNLTGLWTLYLNSNQLSGEIPPALVSLTGLNSGYTDFGYNALYATDPALIAFLSSRDADWASTQTVTPVDVAAAPVGGTTVLVSWTPILYQADSGGYIVSTSPTSGGPYTVSGQTADKTVAAMNVTGLIPGTPYFFVVRTRTDAHANNQNVLESEVGDEVSAATLAQLTVRGKVLQGGMPLPNVVMTGLPGSPVTDTSGVYQATVDVGWGGTVTPMLAGYVFNPASLSYSGIVLDQLNQDFEGALAPTAIALTSPNGGEAWGIGTTHSISWTWTGDMPNVKIEVSTNGGTDWSTVVGSTSNSGSYGWTAPAPASTSCLVRVSDAAYPGVFDTSDAAFSIVSPIPSGERGALIALYNATNGNGWTNNSGWKTPPLDADGFGLPGSEGTWFGVTVGGGTPAVTQIYLANNGLSGALPAELGGLTNLQSLNLDNNQISGPLPSELGGLSNLQSLELSNNPIGGSMPAWMGSLASLREFRFRYGQLTGPIPSELGGLANLQVLDLGFNQFSGSLPASLGNLSQLQILNFVFNQFSGPVPPEFGNLASLQKLYGDYCGVSGSLPAELGNLTNLLELHLPGNALTGAIPPELGNLSNLQVLSLGSNQLSGSIPAALGNLSHLQILSLSANQLTGSIPPELGNMSNLFYMYLSGNGLSGPIPPELGNLLKLSSLELQSNQLTGSIPAELGSMDSVTSIYLNNNLLSGPIPPELAGLEHLGGLDLSYNQLSGPIPAALGTITSLSLLKIASNQLSGPIPPELGNLVNVQYLFLSSNQLSGPIPDEFGNIAALRRLELGSNQLSGSIPSVLGSLSNLDSLQLNANQLTGSIPAALGGLINLRYLNLQSNKLSGSIPAEMGNLVNLRDFVVASNRLSGPIPVELKNLTGVVYFNINYNALFASDPDLIVFLNSKLPGWASTQTVTPADVTASPVGGTTIMVSWTPILYQADPGGYIVSVSSTSGGPYTVVGQTADKTAAAMNVIGLTPGTPYYFTVRAHTDAHANNPNILESDDSGEVAAATFAQLTVRGTILQGGSPLPGVAMTGLPDNPSTNASGVYQAAVDVGWGGTVTPMLAGYMFNPASLSYSGIAVDQLNQDFEATLAPTTIALTAPNGGEAWGIGSTHDITWAWTGDMPNVKIEYSIDGGTNWATIVGSTSNSGSYAWAVPGPASATCLIRVSDAAYPVVSDASDAVFSVITPIPSAERAVLIALYDSTNGDSWTNNSGWKTPPLYADGFAMPGTEGLWRGVAVDEAPSVITISLYGNGLSGSIPTLLGSLANLQYLSLESNQLTGPIPPELGDLGKLWFLNLSHNQLSGTIPAELGSLTSLQYLVLNFNSLSGAIPAELGNLSSLLELQAYWCQLEGPIPAALGNLTQLTGLQVCYNSLTGELPVELGSLTNLRGLALQRNQLSGPIPAALGGLTNLERLELHENQLTGPIPPELGNLANLQRLSLHNNQLTGTIPVELCDLTGLTELFLGANSLEGPLPSEMAGLTALRTLQLEGNPLGGSIPAWLGSLANLQTLGLSSCSLTGGIPPELGNLNQLRILWMHGNNLSGPIPTEFGNLTNLQWLYLNSNKLNGPIPATFANLTNLSTGNLDFNALYATDPGLIAFLDSQNPNWASTQTVTPENVTASALGGATILITWTPIVYQTGPGGYIVSASTTAGGPYSMVGQTADKTISSMTISGLTPGTLYYFVARTRTDAYEYNQNIVESEDSAEVSAATFAQLMVQGTVLQSGLPLPNVLMMGLPGNPATNASGVYQAAVDAGWGGTVTPTLAGYMFAPVNRTYAGLLLDQLNQDYEGALAPTTISLTSPNGGEAWGIGSTHDITWTWTGDMPSVKIEYSTNGGAGWSTIVGSTPNLGSYPWLIPGSASATCLVRVSDAAYPGVSDASDAAFSIVTPIPSAERQVLIDFYTATGGDGWTNNSGWKTPPLYTDGFAMPGTEWTWFGLGLDGTPHVTMISVSNNNLTGSIPASLAGLTELSYLNLVVNNLSGPIPAELGSLVRLDQAYLNNNSLSGDIPAQLGNLVNLRVLTLGSNALTGSIPATLGSLTNLASLLLDHNQLNGSIPPQLGNLANLVELFLQYNQLTGPIPPELGNLSKLERLYLEYNQLSDEIPDELSNLTAVWDLNLSSNQLSGPLPAWLGNLATLVYLSLDGNELTGSIPSELGNLTNLYYLHLSGNQLSGTIPAELGNLTNLRNLSLDGNQLSGSIPPELGNMARLSELWLSDNHLSGSIPPELGNLVNLYDLTITNNELSGSIPAELGAMTNLGILLLDGNELSGSIPSQLGSLANLWHLRLQNNHLSGPIPAELGSLANMYYLHLSGNQLSGAIPPELGSLTNLYELQLSGNQLSGPIPSEIGNLTNLNWLHLAGNRLAGPIPASFVNLTSLHSSLNGLGYNALYATDPDLVTFLNSKDEDWASTQTVTPSDVTASVLGGTTILVSWTPILYQNDTGGYVVSMGTTSGGPYTVVGQTANKSVSSMTFSGLTPGTPYYYVVHTHTDAHAQNVNALDSADSGEVAAATFAQVLITGKVLTGGLPLPNVVMAGLPGNPMTDPSGIYQGLVNVGWGGTVTPTLTSYVFTPYSRSYSGISSDLFDQDYEGGPPTGTITVTSPNGWETWAAGSTHAVTWSSTGGIGSVKIEYSINNGTNWLTVIETTANTGSYSWTVPAPASTACLVKISDAASPGIYDTSDATFKIVIREDFVGTWDGQGVYYRNSDTKAWVKMASPATMITTGDLDGDGIDDLIGLWPTQGGIWVKYSSSGAWAKLSSTAVHIAAGDMNGDGRTDLLGTWDGQGVYYRNSITGAWVKMASPATMITTGDIDGDKTDDLVGIWPSQGGVWVKYSSTGAWARLSSTARDIAAGDMNGDMRDDLLATWDGQGVFYRNSMTGGWIKMASEAEQVTCGDVDADGMDDLIGIWPTQGGVWVKYSSDGTWERLSSTARDITAGVMRVPGAAGAADEDQVLAAAMPVLGLPLPMGGEAEGPETGPIGVDVSDQGPGGARFVYLEELDLEPREAEPARLIRIPGPGEAGVIWLEQKNLFPQEMAKEIKKPIKK